MKRLIALFVIFSCISIQECILCYQCADSSDKSGRNDCQTYVRTMNRYRERYYHQSPTNRYVKNCTGYKGLHDLDIYCMIVEVKTTESEMVRSYYRGCTDGSDFLDVDQSVEIVRKVNFENRTECINIQGGLVACVTICGEELGDFCNGYVSKASKMTHNLYAWINIIVLFYVILSIKKRNY